MRNPHHDGRCDSIDDLDSRNGCPRKATYIVDFAGSFSAHCRTHTRGALALARKHGNACKVKEIKVSTT